MPADPDYSILSGFQGQINRPKTSIFYHVGLVLVAGTMLLLPLVYMAMVGAVGYAVYYHAFHNWGPIMDLGGFNGGGRFMIVKFLIYFTPLAAGVVVVFFMFKPLLAGRPKHAQPLALNPASERMLYAFIEKICDIVGAPSPKRIDLDCQLNAAAGFRRGFFSMFSNDLVLVLGLPLVANLTARELAGVIAHEFGHFTQGAGMRLNYVINSVNFWFARVAYQRDAWDVALETWAEESGDARIAIFIWMIQLSVWFSRLVLKILMLIGHIVGGFMLRQMEYDADAYEIKVSGSECFEQTTRKLATLEAAWGETQKQLVASWKQTRMLPDNLPELIRVSHQSLPTPMLQKIDDTLGLRRTGLFDSHPSPADRIRQARKANDPGIFHDERPAASLFASFEHPSRFVTMLHYTDDIGLAITEQMLTRVEVEKRDAVREGGAGFSTADLGRTYFLGILPLLKPLRLNTPIASVRLEEDYAELNQLAAAVQQIVPQVEGLPAEDARLLEGLTSARAAHRLLNNGFGFMPGTFSLPQENLTGAAAAEEEALAARQELRHSLREVLPVVSRRLELALSLVLANVGETANAADGSSVPDLVAFINQNAETHASQQQLSEALGALAKMNGVKASQGENTAMKRAIAAQEQVVLSLRSQLYPEPASTSALQISKTISERATELISIRKQNIEWLQDYDRKLHELARIAASVESFAHA